MCRLAACADCGLPSWAGCGGHIDAALAGVAPAARCPAWASPAGTCGFVVRRVPNDGACLFAAVDLLLSGGAPSAGGAARLRAAAAAALEADAPGGAFSDAALGEPRAAYAARLRDETFWGGGVELALLARATRASIAVASLAGARAGVPLALTVHEEPGAAPRVYLLHTGAHYDALARGGGAGAFADAAAWPAHDAAALAAAERARAAAAAAPPPRAPPRVACGGCGAVVAADAFAAHCADVAHADDFAFDCAAVADAA